MTDRQPSADQLTGGLFAALLFALAASVFMTCCSLYKLGRMAASQLLFSGDWLRRRSWWGVLPVVLLLAGCTGTPDYELGSGQVVFEGTTTTVTVRDCPGPWATVAMREAVREADPEDGFRIVLYQGPSRYLGHGVALIQCEDYDAVGRLAEEHRREVAE